MFQGIGGFSGTANQMNSATVMPPNSQSNMQQGIGGLGMQQQPQPNQGFGMQQNKGSFGYSPGSRKMYSGGSVEEDEPIRLQTGGPSGPNISGVGFAAQPSMGGFQNLFSAANPNVNTSGIANIFNPPPVYGQQRIMQFGTTQNPLEFGQYAPGVGFKASDMTLDALRGAGKLPSIFDDKGQISAGTDFGKGVRSINFATDIAGESAAAGRDFLGQTMASPEQQSYLMSLTNAFRRWSVRRHHASSSARGMARSMTPQRNRRWWSTRPQRSHSTLRTCHPASTWERRRHGFMWTLTESTTSRHPSS